MPRPLVVSVLALAALITMGCRAEPRVETPEVGEVLPILPLPPDATGVTRNGSADALQLTIHSTQEKDAMLAYYRGVFAEEPWVLISDTQAPDGAYVLYAEAYERPIWVRIERSVGAPGSDVQLSGALAAAVDSARKDSSRRR